jgi:hypothetical protein
LQKNGLLRVKMERDYCRHPKHDADTYTICNHLILFSLRVNTPLLAALVWEISFVEIPRGLPRGVSLGGADPS